MKKKFVKIFSVLIGSILMGCGQNKKPKDIPEPQNQKRPNIILIMADDLGYETLGSYGSDSYDTPNLDKLAQNGMRFQHCYSTPLCTPSRVQLMTGKYNHRNYIGFGLLDPNEKTFAHYLKEEGYKTFVAGKWQLLGNAFQQELAGNKVGTRPQAAGFDGYCLWQIDSLGSRFKDPVLSISDKKTQLYQGGYGPDIFVDHINDFMDQNSSSPFFVYYPMVLTHDPFVPTPNNPKYAGFDSKSKVNDPVYFDEMVNYMDYLVGRIVKKTEDLGILDNTLILFVGDNGTDRDVTSSLNGRPFPGDKGHTTDAGTHVPLIAYWKGKIEAGSVNENLIDFTDFLPTLMETATGQEMRGPQIDGLSFYSQLMGNSKTVREWIFCHYDPNWGKFEPRSYVQDEKWKLYANGELYNLENDVLEQSPLDSRDLEETDFQTVQKLRNVLDKMYE